MSNVIDFPTKAESIVGKKWSLQMAFDFATRASITREIRLDENGSRVYGPPVYHNCTPASTFKLVK